MFINDTAAPRVILDFDVTFSTGHMMSIPVDDLAGDTVDWDTSPLTVIFHLAEKPSIADPEVMLPAEDITLFLNHIFCVQRRKRHIPAFTPEQKFTFKQTLHQLARTVQ